MRPAMCSGLRDVFLPPFLFPADFCICVIPDRSQVLRARIQRCRILFPAAHPFLIMPLAKGAKAPDFTLRTKTADGLVDVRLSASLGQKSTVLLFFPAAFTGVCTQEMCDQTAGLGEYEKLNAAVYGISVDSPHAQYAWAQAHGIKITLLSDLNKTVTTAYDVVLHNFAGMYEASARAAFVIGSDGVIKYAEQTPTPKDLPDFAAIKAALG